MLKNDQTANTQNRYKPWPSKIWPDIRYPQWGEYDFDDAGKREQDLSYNLEEFVRIKEYFDELEEDGIDYEGEHYTLSDVPADWEPEIDTIYWENGEFDKEGWQEAFDEELNRIKLYGCEAAYTVEKLLGYDFVDETLILQSFTRRAFALEYGVASNEELEFFGDAALNYCLTRAMAEEYGEIDSDTDAPAFFLSRFDEGQMSRIREKYCCKEYLAKRTAELGLDQFILYGTADQETESAKEDMMEALIGAVAIDSNWDYTVLEDVADRLLSAHLDHPDRLLQKDYYEIFNSWHQKHYGKMPKYEMSKRTQGYHCTLMFTLPKEVEGLDRLQIVEFTAETRSKARNNAAEFAYHTLRCHGLWMDLKDSGIEPKEENAVSQLYELYQKKYVEEPKYSFKDRENYWECCCLCNTIDGTGVGKSKKEAKKKAAYITLCDLFRCSGMKNKNWPDSGTAIVQQIAETTAPDTAGSFCNTCLKN